jgi:hypothetical protein
MNNDIKVLSFTMTIHGKCLDDIHEERVANINGNRIRFVNYDELAMFQPSSITIEKHNPGHRFVRHFCSEDIQWSEANEQPYLTLICDCGKTQCLLL